MHGYRVKVTKIMNKYLSFSVIRNNRNLVYWDILDIGTKEQVKTAKEFLINMVVGFFEDPPRLSKRVK